MATVRTSKAYWGRCDQSPVLVLKGHVRYLMAWALRASIDRLLAEEPCDTVIIDLRELESIDSTGMGLLAHLGRIALQHGRRAIIVCAVKDVMTCLYSAGFDSLFHVMERWPFDEEVEVTEVNLDNGDLVPDIMGRIVLDAHRELALLNQTNQQAFAGVISALESELQRPIR